MLPDGYTGVVVADTRRAIEWEAGLRAAGFDAVRVETRGDDASKGSWQLGVPARQAADARTFVAEVIRGDASLPSRAFLPRMGWIGLLGVVATVAAWLALSSGRC